MKRRLLLLTLSCLSCVLPTPSRAGGRHNVRHGAAYTLDRAGIAQAQVWKAYRKLHRARGTDQPAAYRQFVREIFNADPALGTALARAGLTRIGTQSPGTPADPVPLWRFLRAVGVGERMILRQVVEPYFHGLVDKRDYSDRQKRQVARARKALPFLAQALGKDAKGRERRALSSYLEQRIDETHSQTHGSDLDLKTLRPGTRRWMYWLQRFARSPLVTFKEPKVIVDAPSWRRHLHKTVANAKGYLYLSGLYWYDDAEGRALARLIVAKKLGIGYLHLVADLKAGRTVAEIRDQALAKKLAGDGAISTADALKRVQSWSEEARVGAVDKLLTPLKVRIYLSMMAQWRLLGYKRLRPRALEDIEAVGGEVLLAHSPLTKRLGLALRNLWSSAAHAKLVLTPNEVSISGFNFGNDYLQADGPLKWHDIGVRLRGEVADAQLRNYVRHWNREAKRSPTRVSEIDLATIARLGLMGQNKGEPTRAGERPRAAGIIVGSDDLSSSETPRFNERAELAYALATFKKSFVTTSPYLTSTFFVERAAAAAERRVRQGKDPGIDVVLPGQGFDEWTSNGRTAHHMAVWLREAGVRVHHWQPAYAREHGKPNRYDDNAFIHAKVSQYDGIVSKISSANKNERSLQRDWETGFVTRSAAVARRIEKEMLSPTLAQSSPSLLFPDDWWNRLTSRIKRILFGDLGLLY